MSWLPGVTILGPGRAAYHRPAASNSMGRPSWVTSPDSTRRSNGVALANSVTAAAARVFSAPKWISVRCRMRGMTGGISERRVIEVAGGRQSAEGHGLEADMDAARQAHRFA